MSFLRPYDALPYVLQPPGSRSPLAPPILAARPLTRHTQGGHFHWTAPAVKAVLDPSSTAG